MIPVSHEVKLYTAAGLEWPGYGSEESCSWESWLEIIV